MKGCVIILDQWRGRGAAARMIDGQLDDFLLDCADDTPVPGTIFRAVCDRAMKGQGGMFVTLEPGLKGFLRQAKGLAPGDSFLVQVTGFCEPGKAVPVSAKVVFKSRFALVTPGAPGLNVARSIRDDAERDRLLEIAHEALPDRLAAGDIGVILRSACAQGDADEIAEDLAQTWEIARQVSGDSGAGAERLLDGPGAQELAWRDWADPHPDEIIEGGFAAHGVLDLIEGMGPQVRLGEGSMYVEPTRALVAVDINTGADTSPAAGLKANLAAARALPRALRLRGLGGQIVLDLAPMAKKDRRTFENALAAAFRADAIDTSLIGWTPLGHFELSRKRERQPFEANR